MWNKPLLTDILGGRFVYLLVCLVLLFIIYPFLDYNNLAGQIILEAGYLTVLLACLRVITSNAKPLRFVVYGLLLLTIINRVAEHLSACKSLMIVGFGVEILFHCIICLVIIGHVMKTEQVTADKIIGAVCAYFFIGVLFALVFALLETASPGSFSVASALDWHFPAQRGLGSGLAFLYFSFITMTTVGYGDITPVSQIATSLSALEAIAGQIYLTVLVARLVALHIADNRTVRQETQK